MRDRIGTSVERGLQAWNAFWFSPVQTSTLALLRIGFGLIVLFWTISLGHDVLAFYSTDGIVPSQPDFGASGEDGSWGLLGRFESDGAVIALYVVLLVAAICLTIGLGTRLAALLVFVGLISFSRRNPWVLNSGDALLHVIAFYFLIAPSGAALSVDRWLRARSRFWEFPLRSGWPLRLLQVQVSILYLTAAWDKTAGNTWREGSAVSYALRIGDLERFPVPSFVVDSLLISNALTYGTLAIELSLGVLVWNRVLRPWVLLLGVSLHLGIDYAVRVGFFSYAVIALYLVFIRPETMSAWILAVRDWVSGRLARSPAQISAADRS